jgi:hypothetical protein
MFRGGFTSSSASPGLPRGRWRARGRDRGWSETARAAGMRRPGRGSRASPHGRIAQSHQVVRGTGDRGIAAISGIDQLKEERRASGCWATAVRLCPGRQAAQTTIRMRGLQADSVAVRRTSPDASMELASPFACQEMRRRAGLSMANRTYRRMPMTWRGDSPSRWRTRPFGIICISVRPRFRTGTITEVDAPAAATDAIICLHFRRSGVHPNEDTVLVLPRGSWAPRAASRGRAPPYCVGLLDPSGEGGRAWPRLSAARRRNRHTPRAGRLSVRCVRRRDVATVAGVVVAAGVIAQLRPRPPSAKVVASVAARSSRPMPSENWLSCLRVITVPTAAARWRRLGGMSVAGRGGDACRWPGVCPAGRRVFGRLSRSRPCERHGHACASSGDALRQGDRVKLRWRPEDSR